MVDDFEAETDTAVGSDRLDDTMTTDTAGTTPDATTDAPSGTQTPASLVDSDIIQRIDSYLLSDDLRQGRKRLKGNQPDNPEVSNYDNRSSPWTTKSGPIVFDRSEGAEQEILEPDGVSKPHNYEGAPPVRLQFQPEIDGSSTSQQSVQAEKEIGTRPAPAMMPDPEDSGSDIAKLYWGRGYALVLEGSELNRFTNNA